MDAPRTKCLRPAKHEKYKNTNQGLCVRALRVQAACSGMDCAVMSGGDVGPLGKDAVTELHGLFRWAAKSPRCRWLAAGTVGGGV